LSRDHSWESSNPQSNLPVKKEIQPGRPFIALHGFTGEGADFSALSSFTGGDWHCPDLPGHGSRKEATDDDFRLSSLEKEYITSEQSGRIGIGYSLGGRILLNLAIRHPSAFDRLVIISSSPGLKGKTEREARRAYDQKWIERLANEKIENFLNDWWQQPVLRSLRNLPPAQLKNLREKRLRNSPHGLIRSLQFHGTGSLESCWESLPELEIPTLVLVGELDQKFQNIGAEMSDLIPQAELRVVQNAGHAPHLEAPKKCSEEILQFLHTE